jgi:hypothetical protein
MQILLLKNKRTFNYNKFVLKWELSKIALHVFGPVSPSTETRVMKGGFLRVQLGLHLKGLKLYHKHFFRVQAESIVFVVISLSSKVCYLVVCMLLYMKC